MASSALQNLDQRIAVRVRAQRQERGLTLDALAERSGVSRAMISRVERGEASPTAALLGRLAGALQTTLSEFFKEQAGETPLVRAAEQAIWRDPATGYLRRNVTDGGAGLDIVEVTLPPGANVIYDNAAAFVAVEQVVWVLEGRLRMGLGDDVFDLATGDSLAMRLDRPVRFQNIGAAPVRYAVVLRRPPALPGARP
jgi:transcriptional regulator with XRE-family HTH domain